MLAFVFPQGDGAPDCNCICRQSTWMPAALVQLAPCASDGVKRIEDQIHVQFVSDTQFTGLLGNKIEDFGSFRKRVCAPRLPMKSDADANVSMPTLWFAGCRVVRELPTDCIQSRTALSKVWKNQRPPR